MNIVMWILAGGVIGWMGYKYMHANEERGVMVSIIIGMVGGFFGGNIVAPFIGDVISNPVSFSPFSLFVSVASAMGCLTISNMVYKRFGV
jgi:uncharacterized membrane protein YeaQ/YmgE (transglycosylase-associated protein family)